MRMLFAMLVVAGCGGATRVPRTACPTPYRASVVAGHPFVWEVRRPNAPTSITLFGTYQAASREDIPAAAWAALARSRVFVAEVDEVPPDQRDSDAIQGMLQLTPDVTLDALVGEATFDKLGYYIGSDYPHHRLRTLKPWVAMLLLSKEAFDAPKHQMSEAILASARDRKLRMDFFETHLEQMLFLDASAGAIKLQEAVRKAPYMHCGITRRLEAYRAGDDVLFTSDVPDAGDPIVPRIARWYEQLHRYADTGEQAFIAIGTANLLGPFGMLARLEADGYEVRRL